MPQYFEKIDKKDFPLLKDVDDENDIHFAFYISKNFNKKKLKQKAHII